jgi:HD-GYP domain-containing protein (c-di-GMP phosphodiesterase class II)
VTEDSTRPRPAATDAGVRLAEVVAALSLATDLGTGHPIERSLRSCLLALRFAGGLGLGEAQLREVYYVALLRWVGCTADVHRGELFGDEITLGPQIDSVELWNGREMLGILWRVIGAGEPPLRRARAVAGALATGVQRSRVAEVAHCEVAQQIASRLGFDAGVRAALGQIFERWDGRGVPGRARGEAVALAVRIVHLAMDAELFARLGGLEAVRATLRRRSGSTYDPALAERFAREAPALLGQLDASGVWETAVAAEPGRPTRLSEAELDAALHAIADFADLRSPSTLVHSPAVAAQAGDAARRWGLPAGDVTAARRAGFVHDVGMVGLPITLCERPGPLSALEWDRLRLHPYYSECILNRTPALARLGALAASHHERLDGSGYHRALPAGLIPPLARLLAAADVYQALTQARPHRSALTPDAAATELRREVRVGRLDGEAVTAVLEAAGHRIRRTRPDQVAGLSGREIEVLHLLVRGHPNRRIAGQLGISERTVDHHIRHIYAKIGVSTRAAATLFATQHGLVGDAAEP